MTKKLKIKALSVIISTANFKAKVIPFFKVPFRPFRGYSLILNYKGEQIEIPSVDLTLMMEGGRNKLRKVSYPMKFYEGPGTTLLPVIDNYGIVDFTSVFYFATSVYVHSSSTQDGDVEYSVIKDDMQPVSYYDKRVLLLDDELPYVKKVSKHKINNEIDLEENISLRVGVDYRAIEEDDSRDKKPRCYCCFADKDYGKELEPDLVHSDFRNHARYAGYVLKLDGGEMLSKFAVEQPFDINKIDLNYFGQIYNFANDLNFSEPQFPDFFPEYIKTQIIDNFESYRSGFITYNDLISSVWHLAIEDFRKNHPMP